MKGIGGSVGIGFMVGSAFGGGGDGERSGVRALERRVKRLREMLILRAARCKRDASCDHNENSKFSCRASELDGSVSRVSDIFPKFINVTEHRKWQIGAKSREERGAMDHNWGAAVRPTVGPSPCISPFQLPVIDHASSTHISPILANTRRLTYNTKYVTG